MSCETKMINSPHANDHKSMEAPCILSTVPASSPVSLSATRTNQPFCHYVQRSLRYDSTCPTTNRDSTHAIIVWIAVGRIGELWGMGYGRGDGLMWKDMARDTHTHILQYPCQRCCCILNLPSRQDFLSRILRLHQGLVANLLSEVGDKTKQFQMAKKCWWNK